MKRTFPALLLFQIRLRDKGAKARTLALDLASLRVPHQEAYSSLGLKPNNTSCVSCVSFFGGTSFEGYEEVAS